MWDDDEREIIARHIKGETFILTFELMHWIEYHLTRARVASDMGLSTLPELFSREADSNPELSRRVTAHIPFYEN